MNDYEMLWKTYAKDIHRFAFHLSNDATLAEDLTSETFVRLWTQRTPLRETTIKAYLFTITRNLYLGHLRKTSRQTRLDEEPVSNTPGQEMALAQKQHQQKVSSALQSLREEERTALLLKSERLTYEELASILGVSQTAAKVKVHRARLKLKKLVGTKEKQR